MKRLPFLLLAALLIGCGASTPPTTSDEGPVVVMDTSMGTIKIQLYAKDSPKTVENFLSYVDGKSYDGTIFHRVMGKENNGKDFMIQGGGFLPGMTERPTRPPVVNESANGLANRRGTLAMARTNDPNSATSQFFINVADNGFLDGKMGQGGGYTVFGKVIDGMDVVDKIKAVKTGQRGPHGDVPLQDVIIQSVRRAS